MQEESRNLRILMISARADYGGGPEHVFRLIEQLIGEDVQIYVACPEEEPYWTRYSNLVRAEWLLDIPHRHFSLRHLWRLYQFVRKHKINLIHSHGKGAGIYGRLLGIMAHRPCIHTFHGIHVGDYNYWQKSLYYWLEQILSSVSSRLISVSPGEAGIIISNRLCRKQKLTVICNGVVLTDKSTGFFPDNYKMIITMTRFDNAKNTELLIKIASYLKKVGRIKEFTITILGTGQGESSFRAEAQKAGFGDYFVFTGAVPNPGDYLSAAFCYLSTSRWEGMPLSVLEAMAVGLPVIATAVVGNCDVVEHNISGLLYDIEQPEKAGEFLCDLADDPGLWQRLSAAAKREVTEKYSVDRMMQSTLRVYKDVFQKSVKAKG